MSSPQKPKTPQKDPRSRPGPARDQKNRPRDEIDQWLEMSRQAEDLPTALEYAQRAVNVQPNDPRVQEILQRKLFKKLRQDPFVAYLAQTDQQYVVTLRSSRPLVVPKTHNGGETYPDGQRTEGERVLGMVWWVVAGLIPAGLGALILSPLVAGRALEVFARRGSDARERRLAWVAMLLAGLAGCLGMVFSLLLVLHLVQ